jgi:hypothetical protein
MRLIASLVLWTFLVPGIKAAGADRPETAAVERTAAIIGVLPQVQQLASLETTGGDPLQVMLVRQEILSKVISASLQVDATVAQIDNEIAQSDELRGYLSDKRDKAVNRANLWSVIAGGGLGGASAGLQLPSGQKTASAVVGIAGGALSAGLAISGIRAQRGATRVFDFNSNMLAQLFERPTLEDSQYDPIVWKFLNDVAPTDADKLTRKERLIHTWYSVGRIYPLSTTAGKRKVDHVTSQPSDRSQLTIDDLEDRSAMLQDVRAKISFLKRDLAALLSSLPESK